MIYANLDHWWSLVLGSHLSDRLIGKGHEAVAMDNLITGRVENISYLM